MKTFEVNYSYNKEPIKINYFDYKNSNDAIVIIGGTGDHKDYFNDLAIQLLEKCHKIIVEFSFRGYEEGKFITLKQQVLDLREVASFLISEKNIQNINLVCTSAGAYSASYMLVDKEFSNSVSKAIFIDPADYFIANENKYGEPSTWSGVDKFDVNFKTSSDLLTKIKSEVKVDVVYFTIRIYGKDGYSKDGVKDNPKLFPRLNAQMVKKFFSNTPNRNKGQYIEVNNIPHAIKRDGDANKNIKRLSDLIYKLIN